MLIRLGRSLLRPCAYNESVRTSHYNVGRLRVYFSTRKDAVDVDKLLSTPTWSIDSLLPKDNDDANKHVPSVSSKQLHHLLRLSALPPPQNAEEEAKMLSTLQSQLHFVQEIQKVDTTGVEPLQSLRDETKQGREEAEIGLDDLRDALSQEEVRGHYHQRIRRKQAPTGSTSDAEKWDVLGAAERKVGRYFVVEGGKEG